MIDRLSLRIWGRHNSHNAQYGMRPEVFGKSSRRLMERRAGYSVKPAPKVPPALADIPKTTCRRASQNLPHSGLRVWLSPEFRPVTSSPHGEQAPSQIPPWRGSFFMCGPAPRDFKSLASTGSPHPLKSPRRSSDCDPAARAGHARGLEGPIGPASGSDLREIGPDLPGRSSV